MTAAGVSLHTQTERPGSRASSGWERVGEKRRGHHELGGEEGSAGREVGLPVLPWVAVRTGVLPPGLIECQPEAGPSLGRGRPEGSSVRGAKFSACAVRLGASRETRGAGRRCEFAGPSPRRHAVTLVVNSALQAELGAGADLSHAQLGVGGRDAAGSVLSSPFPEGFSSPWRMGPPLSF